MRGREWSHGREGERERVRARARGRWKIINERSEVVHRLFSTLSLSLSVEGGEPPRWWSGVHLRSRNNASDARAGTLSFSPSLSLSLCVPRAHPETAEKQSLCVRTPGTKHSLVFFSRTRAPTFLLFYFACCSPPRRSRALGFLLLIESTRAGLRLLSKFAQVPSPRSARWIFKTMLRVFP